MTRFRVTIDGTFEADDIDDALEYLAARFRAMADGKDTGTNFLGRIEIKPEREETDAANKGEK